MKFIYLFVGVCFLWISTPFYSHEIKSWKGNTNKRGEILIDYNLSEEQNFILQGYILFEKNWRPISVFYNKKQIWADLGTSFKNIKYKINIMMIENKKK